MLEISQSISLSQRQTKILATGVRSIVGKSRVEPNIEQKMSEAAHRLDKHFVSTPLELEVKEEGVSVVKIVPFFHVPCVEDFVNDLMASRKLDPHKQDVKIGMDDGQGKLKICLSIVDKQCLKKDSVKKTFVIGMAAGIPESIENLRKMLGLLKLASIDCSFTVDLKLALMLVGKQEASCTHGCIYCTAAKPYTENETNVAHLNTLGSLQESHEKWLSCGAKKKDLKLFNNAISQHLFVGVDNDALILELLVPPELHLLLGIVAKILTGFQKPFLKKFLHDVSVTPNPKWGSALNGEQSSRLLRHVDLLRSKCNDLGLVYEILLVEALTKFRTVKDLMFGKELLPGWEDAIDDFKRCYIQTGLSITPKVHIVFDHLEQFFRFNDKGLGYFSEQCFESIHQDFKRYETHTGISCHHKLFEEKQLEILKRYNSLHL